MEFVRHSLRTARAVLVVALTWGLAGCATARHQASAGPSPVRLRVTPPHDEVGYSRLVEAALGEVAEWFRSSGFEVAAETLIDSVVVLDGSRESRARVAAALGVRAEDLTATFAGTVVGQTLYLVTEERYRQVWAERYPDWEPPADAYRQLIRHELAHRAHEAIAIAELGSADAMGPPWFFEGLAVACAGQFEDGRRLAPAEVAALLAERGGPRPSYPLYGLVFRSLAAHFGTRTLILRAAEAGFPLGLVRERAR
jgi:hypothetical protein